MTCCYYFYFCCSIKAPSDKSSVQFTIFDVVYSVVSNINVILLMIFQCHLLGCIHSTLAASNFFFEKGSQIDHVNARLGTDVTINCTTNYDDANVTLESEQGRSDMIAKEEGRLSRKESVFTIHNIIVQDAGKYTCRATATDGQTITRVVLLMIDTSMSRIKLFFCVNFM